MFWLAPLPAANTGAAIIVLYDYSHLPDVSPTWQRYADPWVAGQPETDPALTPPAGLFQPQRSFGKLWRETAGLRDTLGWATTAEQSFDGAYQAESPLGWPLGGGYLRAADKSILHLPQDGYWTPVQP